MAKITVKLNGQVIASVELENGTTYIAGRASDAQIVLPDQRGLSRHHLKFFQQDDVWICEALSKFVPIQVGAESVEVLELGQSTTFTVSPFEFSFETESRHEPEINSEEPLSGNLPAKIEVHTELDDNTEPKFSGDATVAGRFQQNLIPYLRLSYPNSTEDEVLKLEGHLWVAGRESACEIPISSSHASRRHFEITRTQEGFYVVDLGSSNGTKVNGQRIPAHEPYRIESGDEISIMNVVIEFEIRDTQFENRISLLPAINAINPMLNLPMTGWESPQLLLPGGEHAYPQIGIQEAPPTKMSKATKWLRNKDGRINKVRVLIVAIAPLVLIMAALPEQKRKPASDSKEKKGIVYENLNLEQQSTVKDSFNLAKTLYVQGKYALCVAELAKVHDLVPQFDNSKELQSFCEQGLELVRRQQDAERKRKEREALERQIANYVENCKNNLSKTATVDETRVCLADAMVLSPENPMVVAMLHSAQQREEEQRFLAAQKKELNAKVESGEAHYRRAKRIASQGPIPNAIRAYEKFLNTEYPHIDDEKAQARRELASLRKELKTKVDFLLDQCRTLGSKEQFKDAYISCDKAVKVDTTNTEAKEIRGRMESSLRKIMKIIYQDSVLEESLGNVDSAKEKWRKIVEQDLSHGEYAKKAKSKLRKYEGF